MYLSRFAVGYVCHPDGTIDSVSWTDFEFYQQSDDGTPDDDFEFRFKAGDCLLSYVGKKTYFLFC